MVTFIVTPKKHSPPPEAPLTGGELIGRRRNKNQNPDFDTVSWPRVWQQWLTDKTLLIQALKSFRHGTLHLRGEEIRLIRQACRLQHCHQGSQQRSTHQTLLTVVQDRNAYVLFYHQSSDIDLKVLPSEAGDGSKSSSSVDSFRDDDLRNIAEDTAAVAMPANDILKDR